MFFLDTSTIYTHSLILLIKYVNSFVVELQRFDGLRHQWRCYLGECQGVRREGHFFALKLVESNSPSIYDSMAKKSLLIGNFVFRSY